MKTKLLIGLLLISVILVSGCYSESEPNICGGMLTGNNCCEKCNDFGYDYLNYDYGSSGIGRDGYSACFCNNNTEVIELWNTKKNCGEEQ